MRIRTCYHQKSRQTGQKWLQKLQARSHGIPIGSEGKKFLSPKGEKQGEPKTNFWSRANQHAVQIDFWRLRRCWSRICKKTGGSKKVTHFFWYLTKFFLLKKKTKKKVKSVQREREKKLIQSDSAHSAGLIPRFEKVLITNPSKK